MVGKDCQEAEPSGRVRVFVFATFGFFEADGH
jgi:hypothetical protein